MVQRASARCWTETTASTRGSSTGSSVAPYPVVDLCESFTNEFEHSTRDLDTFMRRYYAGHHTPFGNVFTAWAVMNEVVNWLHPKPVTYRSGVGI